MQTNFKIPDWVKGANIYEVNVRQYTREGTFNAFARHLPRLKDMGVEIIWFMPVTPISSEKRLGTLGSYYAAGDYTKINPEFGSLKDFTNLVNLAHKTGLKVMIDWVANHTGWDHTWTTEHPGFYKRDANGNFFDSNGWDDVIDLDYSNEALRVHMIKAMKYWIDTCDIDGFRCDMAHLVPLDFWERARKELNSIKKDLFWLGETEDVLYHLAFDATYGWALLHAMEKLYKKELDLSYFEDVLKKYEINFPEQVIHLAFTSNHDENSHSGSEYERMGEAAKAFAVLTATWSNCMPLVYSGQELPNKKRLLFFEKDEIEWKGEFWLHGFYKSLLTLHRSNPALHVATNTNNATRIKTTADEVIFAFSRQMDDDQVFVLLNLSPSPNVKFFIDDASVKGTFKSAFSGTEFELSGNDHFELTAWGYLVYYKVSNS